MGETLLAKWLKHYDSIHRGWTPVGIANGVCATCGFSFPRIRGGYNLRRGVDGWPGSAGAIVGAAGHDATVIREFPWVSHAPSTAYQYALFAVGGGGMEDESGGARVEAACDASGEWIGGRPQPPTDLRVVSLSGGRFAVKWTYAPVDGPDEPSGFHLYADGGSGTIDYAAPVAVVVYGRGRCHYEYVSAAFAHGSRVRWAVRAVTARGVEELNGQQAIGWAEAAPAAPNPTVLLAVADD